MIENVLADDKRNTNQKFSADDKENALVDDSEMNNAKEVKVFLRTEIRSLNLIRWVRKQCQSY